MLLKYLLFATAVTFAQTPETPASPAAAPAAQTAQPEAPKVFGILPNYSTAELSEPFQAITVKRKMYIGFRDSTDLPVFAVGAVLAGYDHLMDKHPSFGQGWKGYGHRFLTSSVDQLTGNMMVEGVAPSLFHQDPRYFRKGTGSFKSRLGYALSRLVVTRNDSGKWAFNASELTGVALATGISNAYYPHERKLGDNLNRATTLYWTDGLSFVLKEFWPDISKKLFKK